jgi:hypothetical protein
MFTEDYGAMFRLRFPDATRLSVPHKLFNFVFSAMSSRWGCSMLTSSADALYTCPPNLTKGDGMRTPMLSILAAVVKLDAMPVDASLGGWARVEFCETGLDVRLLKE